MSAPIATPRTFQQVHAEVRAHAAEVPPAVTFKLNTLAMLDDQTLLVPGGARWSLGENGRRCVATALGIRWNRWHVTATEAQRAAATTAAFQAAKPTELRAVLAKDPSGAADAILRAFTPASFRAIDEARMFRLLAQFCPGLVEEVTFPRVDRTETTVQFTAEHCGDDVRRGWVLRTSDTGACALTVDEMLVIEGGRLLFAIGGRSLYRTHRPIEDDTLAAALTIALGRMTERWDAAEALVHAAKSITVKHPGAAVHAMLGDNAWVPKGLLTRIEEALGSSPTSRLRVALAAAQAIASEPDPTIRFEVERAAGAFVAATEPVQREGTEAVAEVDAAKLQLGRSL